MGTLIYAGRTRWPIHFDDRTLVHLQLVIAAKLRLQQPFFFSWVEGVNSGGGRSALWLDPGIALTFQFNDDRPHLVNREWLAQLNVSANSAHGLQLFAETPVPPEPGLRTADDAEARPRVPVSS